jgi:hypothetical protein
MAARGWLMESEITEALVRACEGNNYLRDHGMRATMKTIESGIRDGLKVEHEDLEDRDDSAAHARAGNGADQQQQSQQGKQEQKQKDCTQRKHTTGNWDDPDLSIVDDRRGDLPDLPIDAFPKATHRWMRDAARGAGVTIDHIATPLIGIASIR